MTEVSNHYDAMTAIQAMIEGLGLIGVTGGVVIQEVAYHEKQVSNTTLPFISISPYGPEFSDDWTVETDEVDYPILVAIYAEPDVTQLNRRLYWRQQIRRNLRNVSFTTGNLAQQNYRVYPKPGNCIEPQLWFKRLYASGIVAMVQCDENRTAT